MTTVWLKLDSSALATWESERIHPPARAGERVRRRAHPGHARAPYRARG